MITAQTDPHQAYADKYEEPARHMEALYGALIITLDLNPRILCPLWDAGIRTVSDLARNHSRIADIRLIGARAAEEIERILICHGLV